MLTLEDFTPLVGAAFNLVDPPGELMLIEAEGSPTMAGALRLGFSLMFSGPHQAALEQRIHALHHAALGTIELFLVPVSRVGDTVLYQAIFA